MLSAASIKDLINSGAVTWDGELRGDGLLLKLGGPIQPLVTPDTIVDLADQASIDTLYGPQITDWTTHDLAPGQMILAPASEPVSLGPDVTGTIGGLSHLARVGLAVHITSPYVLPGWAGHLALELVNHSPAILRLHHGMPLARLVLQLRGGGHTAAAHPYYGRSNALQSRYADELAGPNQR
ncbi:dCTP deaminase domain-containing protein [Streptomyces sp. NBC_00096]|uniref:dCTP deaminase n=1 Tax=Streptomyces sp. NBC_00096 TaxID=2975650 RepID=UPI003243945E